MMNNLSSYGVKWFHNGSMVKSIVITICCVVDSVARYQVLNFTNFFGHYGCTFCYVKTQYIQKTGSRYPVTNEPAAARNYYKTHILKVSAMKATFDRAYRGVKGTCNLIDLHYFSIFDNFVVDYMHNLLLGCVKRHTTLILESSRKNMWIDVHENNVGIKTLKAVIDERIATVQSSTAVIRELRGISDMSLWRANEWQQWLLFYFVTCLTGLLKPKFILHFALLSKAAFILLQISMTHADLQMAHKLLMSYTFYFQKCFGEKNMVYNIHLLSHVVRGVYNFGPIWGHSSFMYETQNRYLLQLCRSPNSVSLQVARKFSTFKSLPNLSESLGCSDRVADFSKGILNYKRLINCRRANDNQCILMGQPQVEALPAHISKSLGTSSQNCLLYQRCIYKNKRYTTNKYCKGIANNDSYLFLGSGECVNIEKIVKIPDSQRVFLLVQIVALDRKPLYQNDNVKYDCVSKVVGFKGYKFERLDDVGEPCLLISVSGVQYVARSPYGCTVE